MRIKKKNLSNFVFIILLVVLLLTPVGFHVKVVVSRIFSFSPSVLDTEEQLMLTNYDWKLSRLDSTLFNFEKVEGKIAIVNFWATWCPPCVAEMPSLQELHKDFGEKVEFVLIAHDEREKVSTFLDEKNYDFPIYFERSSGPDVLSPKYIPTTFILDRTGKIVVKKTGAADWNSSSTRQLLESLIKK